MDIIAKGKTGEKLVKIQSYEGEVKNVTPVVGRVVGKQGNNPEIPPGSELGIGYQTEDGDQRLWAMVSPQHLIQSWRAVKFIEAAQTIDTGTLSGAYYAAADKITASNDGPLIGLAKNIQPELQINKPKGSLWTDTKQFQSSDLKALRDRVMRSFPRENELREMLTKCLARDTYMMGLPEELDVYADQGFIPHLTGIGKIRAINEAAEKAYWKGVRGESFDNKPVPASIHS